MQNLLPLRKVGLHLFAGRFDLRQELRNFLLVYFVVLLLLDTCTLPLINLAFTLQGVRAILLLIERLYLCAQASRVQRILLSLLGAGPIKRLEDVAKGKFLGAAERRRAQ